jgi:hypothetical protein
LQKSPISLGFSSVLGLVSCLFLGGFWGRFLAVSVLFPFGFFSKFGVLILICMPVCFWCFFLCFINETSIFERFAARFAGGLFSVCSLICGRFVFDFNAVLIVGFIIVFLSLNIESYTVLRQSVFNLCGGLFSIFAAVCFQSLRLKVRAGGSPNGGRDNQSYRRSSANGNSFEPVRAARPTVGAIINLIGEAPPTAILLSLCGRLAQRWAR